MPQPVPSNNGYNPVAIHQYPPVVPNNPPYAPGNQYSGPIVTQPGAANDPSKFIYCHIK